MMILKKTAIYRYSHTFLVFIFRISVFFMLVIQIFHEIFCCRAHPFE